MIILTGGAGFIGSNLLGRLNREGEDRILIVDDLTNSVKFRNLVGKRFLDFVSKHEFYDRLDRGDWDGVKVEAVLHQGANTNTLDDNGASMIRTNYEASKSALHFCLRRKAKLIYASTAAVYGRSVLGAVGKMEESPLNIYGFSKLLFDNYVRRLTPESGSTVVGLRYFNAYGSGEQHKGRMASMVLQFANQIQETGVAKLFGAIGPYPAGEQKRDFVSVNDLVEINLFFLNRGPTWSIVDAGLGVRSTWNEVAQAVIRALGRGSICYIDFPASLTSKYQFDTCADLSQLKAQGYTGLMTGMREGVQAYVSSLCLQSEREDERRGAHSYSADVF